jgi:predicted AAA+ superfamily ATPase
MKNYKPRIADRIIQEYLKVFGAVIVEGARATGKTTSSKNAAGSSVSLDESPTLAAMAQTDPSTLFSGKTPILIDEWQLSPNVWNAVRHEVDKRSSPGQFIMTGSATPNDDTTRHSGAGRFGRIKLRTMSLFESGLSTGEIPFQKFFEGDEHFASYGGPGVSDYAEAIVKGGWPGTLKMSPETASIYIQSYIEDITRLNLSGKTDPVRVKALIRAISRNIATEASLASIAGESKIFDESARDETNQNVSIPTARKYLDDLTKIFVLEELAPWPTHIRSKVRQRVSPKWHYIDPSIAAASLQLSSKQLINDPETLGFFFESLCIRDLRIFTEYMRGSVSYYRDEKNLEIDAIAELFDGRWAGFEIKLGGDDNIEKGAQNLLALQKKLVKSKQRDMTSLNVLTAGNVSYTRPDGVNVVSLGHIGVDASDASDAGL